MTLVILLLTCMRMHVGMCPHGALPSSKADYF